MRLTAKGEYALRAVLHLADNPTEGLLKLNVISEKEKISLPYLHQLVKNLKRDGIIISSRGPDGGYALGRSSKDISVLQVLASAGEQIASFNASPTVRTKSSKFIKNLFMELDKEAIKLLDVPISTLEKKND